MNLILITIQALIMNWYIAKIVFNISAEGGDHKPQFDEQLRLITADDREAAFHKARTIGISEEDSCYNDNKKKVKWEFINVSELIPLQTLEDGVELYSRIHETDEANSYINFVHQKAISLRLNAMPLF
jgi:hypothetical protein